MSVMVNITQIVRNQAYNARGPLLDFKWVGIGAVGIINTYDIAHQLHLYTEDQTKRDYRTHTMLYHVERRR